MRTIRHVSAIDDPWRGIEPVAVGPGRVSIPSSYVCVSDGDAPVLRVDVSTDAENPFDQVAIWDRLVVIGCGSWLHMVDLETRDSASLDLGAYFAGLVLKEELYVATANRVWCLDGNATVLWKSPRVGIDGVRIDEISQDHVLGQGEWDPPGGWRPFRLRRFDGTLAQDDTEPGGSAT